ACGSRYRRSIPGSRRNRLWLRYVGGLGPCRGGCGLGEASDVARGSGSRFEAAISIVIGGRPMTVTSASPMSNTGEDAQLLDTIERWTMRELKPIVREYDHDDRYPATVVEQMKELGLFGATVSEDYGGLGLSAMTYSQMIMIISSGWMSGTGIINSHLMLARAIPNIRAPQQKTSAVP